jgi:hypothetical protein
LRRRRPGLGSTELPSPKSVAVALLPILFLLSRRLVPERRRFPVLLAER